MTHISHLFSALKFSDILAGCGFYLTLCQFIVLHHVCETLYSGNLYSLSSGNSLCPFLDTTGTFVFCFVLFSSWNYDKALVVHRDCVIFLFHFLKFLDYFLSSSSFKRKPLELFFQYTI